MALGREHLRDPERRQLLAGIVDALDLEPDARQRLGHFIKRRPGLEMLLEPRKGEFHSEPFRAPAPAAAHKMRVNFMPPLLR